MKNSEYALPDVRQIQTENQILVEFYAQNPLLKQNTKKLHRNSGSGRKKQAKLYLKH